MLNRLIHLSVVSLLLVPALGCSSGDDDGGLTFGSSFTTFPTTASTTMGMETSSTGDGDGDPATGDGDGDPTTTTTTTTTGDGDGDQTTTTTGDGDGDDTSCPPGDFNCPCDNGLCAVGLECIDGVCQLPDPTTSGDGDGDMTTTTTNGGNDPYDPDGCAPPSEVVNITDFEGSVCSPPCADNDADCPVGPNGTQALCLLTIDDMDPSNCVLVCSQGNDTCPVGSTCKPIPMDNLNGLCTYP